MSQIDFKQLFETVPGLYLILDPKLMIVAVNNAYNQATMTKRDEIIGHHLFEIFPDNPNDFSADGVSNLSYSLNYVIKNKKPHSMAVQKYDIRRPDGTFEERFWSPLNSPILDENGKLVYIIHRVEDVTEFVNIKNENSKSKKNTKKLESKLLEMETEIMFRSKEIQKINAQLESKIQQLQESETKFQKAFQASAAAMTITRLSDSSYLDVNNTFVKMSGFPREQILGKTSTDLNLILDTKKRDDILKELKEKGSIRNLEFSVINRFGKRFEIMSSIETVTLNREKYAINIIYDITERKKAEQELAEVNRDLEAFSYSVSHDLQSPLRTINAYIENLIKENNGLNKNSLEILHNIKHFSLKMSTLIDDLLNFSHLGKKEIHKTTIDMNELVEGVLSDLKKVEDFNTIIEIKNLHSIYADYGLINQVLFNLLSNSIKYSSKKEKARIQISSSLINQEIVFSVKDNGVGFDMKSIDKLFGVFQRLHSQEDFHGTGVGLAIVHRIITKHGGRVWAEAKVNEGATFYFTIPSKELKA